MMYEKVVKRVEIEDLVLKSGGLVIENVVAFDGRNLDDGDYERLSDLLDEVGYEMIEFEGEKCVLRLK